MPLPKIKVSRKVYPFIKGGLGVIIVLLLGAFGLEWNQKDWDLGALLRGEGLAGSEVVRDERGNVDFDGVSPPIVACRADTYNCSDFKYRDQAEDVFRRCGGAGKDVNRLDADGDGRPCENLPERR
ncbi:MAG TPA: hypothetical protein ENJ77_01230 [Candidatus Moranbacteria bacterium]|nr:hypothetical protein [Candidatus Moranbacteria bacterium]